MSESVLTAGEKLHVITRRLFQQDVRRHFVGVVIAADDNLVKLEGYAFILNPATNQYQRHANKRMRVISLCDAGNIINILPDAMALEALTYHFHAGKLVMTDGKGYELDLSEFLPGS